MNRLVIAVDPDAGQRAIRLWRRSIMPEEGGRDQYAGSCVCWPPPKVWRA